MKSPSKTRSKVRLGSSPGLDAATRKVLRLVPGYDPIATAPKDATFDADAANRAVAFFAECLTHVEGALAGHPFALCPWQEAIIRNAFGWKRADGTRRYRELFVFVPRKNGKSTMCAGIALLLLFQDDEPGAQIYSAAAEREQAALVFRQAKAMVRCDDLLSKSCTVYQHAIVRNDSTSSYKAISAEAGTKHGFNSHGVIIDELHAQPNRDLVDVLITSTGSRRQPLIVHITTAGFDRNSICWEKYEYACKVRDGIIDDPSFLPVLYEGDADADWSSESTWYKANPNLGISLDLEYLRRECTKAQEQPSYEQTFRRLHLNQWTESDVRWLPMDKWDACATWTDTEDFGDDVHWHGGLDLATTTDVSAFVLVCSHGGTAYVKCWFWVPGENARKRERRDRVPYTSWRDHLEFTEGNVIDYDVIRERIIEIGRTHNIVEIAVDRWNSTQLQTQLAGDGFSIIQFGQGFASMSAPSKELEKRILSGTLAHGGNPVLRWMASNVMIETDAAGNIKPSKKKSTEKIDGIVALVMALARLTAEPMEGVYESRGLLSV